MIRNPKLLKFYFIKPRTVFHIGAHHAQDDENYNSLGATKVVWVEGDRRNIEWLRKNKPNLDVRHRIMWNEVDTIVDFYCHSDSSQSSINIPSTRESFVLENGRTSTLESEFDVSEFRKPVALVIDVQGSELQILKGAGKFLESVSFLIVEISYKNDRYQSMPEPEEIYSLVISRGFAPSIRRVSHDGTYCDQLFIKSPKMHLLYVRAWDAWFSSLLSVRHLLIKGHLPRNYMNCPKCNNPAQ